MPVTRREVLHKQQVPGQHLSASGHMQQTCQCLLNDVGVRQFATCLGMGSGDEAAFTLESYGA